MLGLILWVLNLAAAVWVIYDVFAVNRQIRNDTAMKVVWTVLAVFFSIITAIIYYFVYKR